MNVSINRKDTPEEGADKRIEEIKLQGIARPGVSPNPKRLSEAAIDEQEHRGVISHDQAIQEKLKLDEQYATARIALEQKVRQAEIAERKQQQSEAIFQQRFLTQQVGIDSNRSGVAAGHESKK